MSKRIWQHPEVPAEDEGIASWRSVGELEQTPQFQAKLEREFPEGSGFLNEEQQEESRRGFMKLMGASAALSGLALVSCRRPEAYIVPYKKAPEWVIPGKPLYYATAQPRAGGAVPLVVTTYEGRPTKLEPNREHPDGGGLDAFTQSSVLDLYDPNRSRDFLHDGEKSSREDFSAALAEIVAKGGRIGFLFGEDDCPTRNRLKGELATALPGAKFYSYEALEGAARREVYANSFQERTPHGDGAKGVGAALNVDFSKADRILSLDCDFLGLDGQGGYEEFSKRRQGGAADYEKQIDASSMNRLYSVETAYSLTGGMADHRMRVAPSRVLRVAVDIARALGDKDLSKQLEGQAGVSAEEKAALLGDAATFDSWVQACAADLVKNAGRSVVLAGTRQQGALHQLVLEMNRALKAFGGILNPVATGRAGYGTLADLQQDLASDDLEALFLLGSANPAYDTAIDQELALHKTVTVHLGLRTDKTAHASTWHVPAAHYLESWSDARTEAGSYCLVQPMILPLYDGTSELELLAQILAWKTSPPETPLLVSGEVNGAASPAYDAVRATFVGIGGEGDDPWKDSLKDGFVAGTTYQGADLASREELGKALASGLQAASASKAPSPKNLEVNFLADASVWDGRQINNAWLQEAPDPISKLAWDNAAYVSPTTAKELGVYDQLVELEPISNTPIGKVKNAPRPPIGEGQYAKAPYVLLTANGKELKVPVLVAFGHADNCVSISVGYGQGASDDRDGVPKVDPEGDYPLVGWVGVNSGFNANALRDSRNGGFLATGAKILTSEDRYPVALLQEHNAMQGRALAREVSTNEVSHESFEDQIERVRKQGPVDSHAPENKSQYLRRGSAAWQKDGDKQEDLISDKIHQWGMAIDLNVCTGCNSCLIACQAENNIPIVGKEQVAMGREMHWIRMDRYYSTPTYERDDHGHAKKDESVPEWVSQNPELVPQPMACVQCENAPCETVCPVNATVHTEEGLNAMAYNRCIGTRYCANNCPYKARRFNYFDYNKRNPLIPHNLYKGPLGETQVGKAPHLQRNPNVSVRMRGVMEKCTYCVQRLESAKIKQKQVGRDRALRKGVKSTEIKIVSEDLRIKPDSVKTACQEACPTGAISFGNLLDKKASRMWRAKYKGEGKDKNGFDILLPNPRNYDVLNYVGTVPRTSYLARVKNPNEAMPDAKYRGLATVHTHTG